MPNAIPTLHAVYVENVEMTLRPGDRYHEVHLKMIMRVLPEEAQEVYDMMHGRCLYLFDAPCEP